MNMLITKDIERATDSTVTYSTDPQTADTTYTISKPIDGKPQSVNVVVSAVEHAATAAHDIVRKIVAEAGKLFAELREKIDGKATK